MCCPVLSRPAGEGDSGGVLTLAVPESRPPVLSLTTGDLVAVPEDQPELFVAVEPALTCLPTAVPSRQLAAAGRACVIALVDVLTGRRPAHQLARWTTDRALADLTVLSRTAHRYPVRPAHPCVQVASTRAAEIVIPFVPARGDWAPLRVVAARVEPFTDRWRCVHLSWISSPQP